MNRILHFNFYTTIKYYKNPIHGICLENNSINIVKKKDYKLIIINKKSL